MKKISKKLLVAFLGFGFPLMASAVPVAYTDPGAFLANLPGPSETLDFDSLAPLTVIGNGDTVDGITFNYDFGGIEMMVTDLFSATSGPNSLGTTDADVLQDGDEFSLSFAPTNAIGMYFITIDPMFDDDITLSAGGGSVGLSVADAGLPLPDDGVPFFLGLIDNANTFTTAEISNIGGGFFLYNVDDIVTSVVPLPGAAWLFLSGLIGLFAARKKAASR